jgi:hypothetical protein
MTGSGLALTLAGAWAAVGLGVGVMLVRQGQPLATAATALLVWPALLPLLAPPDQSAARPVGGPFAERIRTAFAALRAALADPALASVADPASLDPIEASLCRADARIAAVDRLLEDGAVAADPASARLHKARAHSAQEVEEVLRKLVTVRVQLGLVALAGDTEPVRCHLGELASRARALEELAC